MISPWLVYGPTAEQVARAIVNAHAYFFKPCATEDDFFTWKSGTRAPVYTDCRVLAGDPGASAIVAKALGSSVRANFPRVELIVGVAEAGIIWETAAALDLARPHAFVRKEKKAHGRPALVECSPTRGAKAVLIDDLVASGGSLERAVKVLRDERDITVIGIQSIVNWDFVEMRDLFERLDIAVRALVSFPHILEAAKRAGILNDEAADELETFYRCPTNHVWNMEALNSAASKSRLSAAG